MNFRQHLVAWYVIFAEISIREYGHSSDFSLPKFWYTLDVCALYKHFPEYLRFGLWDFLCPTCTFHIHCHVPCFKFLFLALNMYIKVFNDVNNLRKWILVNLYIPPSYIIGLFIYHWTSTKIFGIPYLNYLPQAPIASILRSPLSHTFHSACVYTPTSPYNFTTGCTKTNHTDQ